MNDTFDKWEEFLNPEVVRTKLIAAGLFLVAYEMLLDSIKRHPLWFFSQEWTDKGAIPSSDYQSKVLALDPKGKADVLRGSIAWLRGMEAISADDEDIIHEVTNARNEVAHEMSAMVGGSKPPIFMTNYAKVLELTQKIEKWWIVNVELPTNPDYDGAEIDEDGIISGPSWTMQVLGKVALGEGDEAWEYHREFTRKRKGEGD